MVTFLLQEENKDPKCFEPYWLKDDECFEFFDKLWIPDHNPSVNSVISNLGSILDHFLEWCKQKHGILPLKIKQVKEKFDTLCLVFLVISRRGKA